MILCAHKDIYILYSPSRHYHLSYRYCNLITLFLCVWAKTDCIMSSQNIRYIAFGSVIASAALVAWAPHPVSAGHLPYHCLHHLHNHHIPLSHAMCGVHDSNAVQMRLPNACEVCSILFYLLTPWSFLANSASRPCTAKRWDQGMEEITLHCLF